MNDAHAALATWCEISASALAHNLTMLRQHLSPQARLGAVVKSNAYGHGVAIAARAFLEAGADWLIVNSAREAVELRSLEPHVPIYVCGPVLPFEAAQLVAADARTVCYDPRQVEALGAAARGAGTIARLHLKVETGNNRQGLGLDAAIALGKTIAATPGCELEGIATHYADIEDTTEHRFARAQLEAFEAARAAFESAGLDVPMAHSANSAATILWPETHGDLVRPGIATYGHWPSTETYATALSGGTSFVPELRPALSWRARIAQIKDVPADQYVGYGRTYRTTHDSRIAVLPVGYFEGYDRRLSNIAYVLIEGRRAPVRGRVCMNMIMVDVTHIADVTVDSVATLIGRDGDENVSPEQLAGWMGSINYEVLSRIHPSIPRVQVA